MNNVFPFIDILFALSFVAQIIAIFTGFSPFAWKFFALIKIISFLTIIASFIYVKYTEQPDEMMIREVSVWTDVLATITFMLQRPL